MISENFAEILGHLCGDGQIKKESIVYWNTRKELLDSWEQAVKNEFDTYCWRYLHKNVYASGTGKMKIVRTISKILVKKENIWEFKENVLLKEKTKAAFLRALFDDDGSAYLDKNKQRRFIKLYSAKSENLEKVRNLLFDLGIGSKVYGPYTTGFGNKLFELKIMGKDNFSLFFNKIGFKSTNKMKKLQEIIYSYHN